jgi:hypothetical protein
MVFLPVILMGVYSCTRQDSTTTRQLLVQDKTRHENITQDTRQPQVKTRSYTQHKTKSLRQHEARQGKI